MRRARGGNRNRAGRARPRLLLLVAALAVGVVAMHVLAGSPSPQTAAAAPTTVTHVAHQQPATSADDGGTAHDGAHSVPHGLLAACLALVGVWCLTLRSRRSATVVATDPAGGTRQRAGATRTPAPAPPPRPPDLVELSVVRC